MFEGYDLLTPGQHAKTMMEVKVTTLQRCKSKDKKKLLNSIHLTPNKLLTKLVLVAMHSVGNKV